MQNYCKTIGALAAVSALVAGNAMAEVEYELHTGYSSAYLFRGINEGQDLIEAGFDAKTDWNCYDFRGGVWYGSVQGGPGKTGVYSNGSEDGYDQFNLYGQVSRDFDIVTLGVGYIYRNFGSSWYSGWAGLEDTQEVYFTASRDFGGYEVSATYFLGVDGHNGGYCELAVAKSWGLTQCLNIGLNSTLGYLAEEGDFTHFGNRVSLNWEFAHNATISPFIEWDISLYDSGPRNNHRGQLDNYLGAKNQLIGGAMLSVRF